MTTQLTTTPENDLCRPAAMTFAEAMRLADVMMESGFFPDVKSAAQACVKILAGAELGFGPFASMSGIHIVKGKAEPGANLLAVCVKRSGRYNYRVVNIDNARCEIHFFENGEPCGISTFTIEDAKKAGTQNLDKFPRNMLFARAMSNGIKWFCPDAENGVSVYAPGEISDAPPLEHEDQQPRTAAVEVKPTPQVEQPADAKAGHPKTGKELHARLSAKDAELGKKQLIKFGVLIKAVKEAGALAAGAPPLFEDWTPAQVAFGSKWAMDYIHDLENPKKAAKGGQHAASEATEGDAFEGSPEEELAHAQ